MTTTATAQPRQPQQFRFSVLTTGGTAESITDWAGYARRVEALGFSVLQVADHYVNSTVCTPRLAAAAAATESLRVGSYVYNNDFRHPVLLAREAAEIDVLSNGRMELGLGAGWVKEEYDQIGLAFDPGPRRAERYEEAVTVIRQLHESGGPLTHYGKHYQLSGCELLVTPVQRPIPLLVGGGGPRMIRFAAAHADTVAFVPKSLPGGGLDPAAFSAVAFQDKIDILDRALAATPPVQPPERAVLAMEVHRTYDDIPAADWAPREVVAEGPFCLVGDTEQIIDTLLARRDRWGITHWTCWEENLDTFIPVVDRLAGA